METKVQNDYAQRFEQIKARFKLKNRGIAQIAGVSDNSISKIVSGVTEHPDVKTLVALGRKLNLNADWLLYGEGPMVKEEVLGNDESLKKGLKLRDELIAQLQKELWGKLEGVTDLPLLLKGMSFDEMYCLYLLLMNGQVDMMLSKVKVFPEQKLVAPRFQVLETRH